VKGEHTKSKKRERLHESGWVCWKSSDGRALPSQCGREEVVE
jgi:hypothetical protein